MQTAEIQEIRQLARQFAESELRPHVERWDHDGALDPAALAQLAELGFFGMLIPEAYGGMEFDEATYAAVLEELAWGEPAVALTVAASSVVASLIVRHGSDVQKRRWLEPMARGEVLAGSALSVLAAGPLTAQAARVGTEWKLAGQIDWMINGRGAQLALILAQTGAGDDSRDAGAFLVPTDLSGYTIKEREQTMGLRPLEFVTVALQDVPVDSEAVLGDVTQGREQVVQIYDIARLGMAAIAVGVAQAALDHAVGYADVREQFGQKLREFEGLQFKLAEMATRVAAARALLQSGGATAAMAKLFASETAMWVTTQAVQIYGGYGYMRDYPVEKLMRDAKATELLAGTNEMQRVLIARELYQ